MIPAFDVGIMVDKCSSCRCIRCMLQLRPICENCAKPLPPHAEDARICSYECTFCADCVSNILLDVCPNCGGCFEKRPLRPTTAWRENTGLAFDPPVTEHRHKPVKAWEHDVFSASIARLKPSER
jgi:uncharacterized protein